MWPVFAWIFGRRPVDDGWDVRTRIEGRGAAITYLEGANEIPFDFELGDAGRIHCPPSANWDERFPWAAGRRDLIVERVATEFVRRQFKGYAFGLEDGHDDIIGVRRRPRT
jgi:hypothetical protein